LSDVDYAHAKRDVFGLPPSVGADEAAAPPAAPTAPAPIDAPPPGAARSRADADADAGAYAARAYYMRLHAGSAAEHTFIFYDDAELLIIADVARVWMQHPMLYREDLRHVLQHRLDRNLGIPLNARALVDD
jgi:hypothetical protein